MDTSPEPTDDTEETVVDPDRDEQSADPDLATHAPQQDIGDTPVPQRHVDLYQPRYEISDRFYHDS